MRALFFSKTSIFSIFRLNRNILKQNILHKIIFWTYLSGLLIVPPFVLIGQPIDSTTIQIKPAADVETLVFEEFIKKGNCIQIENIQPIGNIKSIGSFTNAKDIIGIKEGIVFTTGDLGDIPGPNSSTGITGGHYGMSEAPYLERVVRGVPFFDVIGIEFDFTPTSDFVSFNYVFASEEYCEYVDSEFNDAFGFFVSGPGIDGTGFNGSVNVAKIEQKNDAVTINTVNHLRNQSFFVNNLTRIDGNQCDIEYSPNNIEGIEFDGYTTKLQAFFSVIPCETYHIRLVVGDVSDDILDSAVFLEGKSFDTGGKANIRALVNGRPDSIVYENCLNGEFIIDRSKLSDRNNPLELELTLLGTATNGLDFEVLPSSVTLDPREFRKDLPLTILPDDLAESLEYVDLVVKTTTCDCEERDTARLYIKDSKEDLIVEFEDDVVCPGQTFTLTPNVPDGIAPLIYKWNSGDTIESITDVIFEPTNYAVTVTDICGATNNDAIEVQLQPVPSLELAGDFSWCAGRPAETVSINLPGQAPWTLNYTLDNQTIESIKNINSSPYSFPLTEVGLYEFIGFNDRHCNGVVSGEVAVSDISFGINPTTTLPSCQSANDGQLSLNFEGGSPPFAIQWNVENQTNSILPNLVAGEYSVDVRDQLGCVVDGVYTLPDAPAFARCNISITKHIYVPNVFSPNGDGQNDNFTIFPKFGLIQSVSYQLFNRWGNLVFQSKPMDSYENLDYWTGENHQAAVYYCAVTVTLSDGTIEHFGTDVTVVY